MHHGVYCAPEYVKGYLNFTGSPSFEQSLGDGQWHRMDWHIKMNSSIGAQDGLLEFSVDKVLEYSRSDIAWVADTGQAWLGWNTVGIGSNSFTDTWLYSSEYLPNDEVVYNAQVWRCIQLHTNKVPSQNATYWTKISDYIGTKEQWYAIDDVTISSTPLSDTELTTTPKSPASLYLKQ